MLDTVRSSQLTALTRAISVLEQRHTQEIKVILPAVDDVYVDRD